MKLLLKSIKIYDPASKFHLQTKDILLLDGKIASIEDEILQSKEMHVFSEMNAGISPGFIDMNMHVFEPGLEYREDFNSALKAGAKGGFTALCSLPNTNPPTDNKSQIEYIKNSSKYHLSEFLPYGAISQGAQGKDLAEIYDMYESGAVGFSDGNHAVFNAGLMERALLYVKKIDAVVCSFPDHHDLAAKAQMNEGINSTMLGMEGASNLSEELLVSRDLYLLEHTNSRLHFLSISTAKSVALIREAKAKGLKVTASVNVANLYFDDSALMGFDTNFKVKPHLRTQADINALLEGLKDGTIDAISSGHTPLHIDEKKLEFNHAEFGMSTLDCAFAVARTATKNHLSEEALIAKFVAAYEILGIQKSLIEQGSLANFTIFNLNSEEVFNQEKVLSKGKNNAFVGESLNGTCYGVIKGNKTNIL